MNLKKLIGKMVVRTKPMELYTSSKGFWNFSFMTSPIQIVDVGDRFIFYKTFLSFNKADSRIECLELRHNDNNWEEYHEDQKSKYLENNWKWHDIYEKRHPKEIALMRNAY